MLPSGIFSKSYAQDTAIVRTRFQWIALAVLLVFLFILPLIGPRYYISLAIWIGISIIAALGLHILLGLCGQISIAQMAFMAVGGFGSGVLTAKLGLPFWVALPAGAILAGFVGIIIGIPSLRVKGLYLCLVSIGAQILIVWGIQHLNSVTHANTGLVVPAPTLGDLVLNTRTSFYYVTYSFVVLITLITLNLSRSKVGRAWIAIRDNEVAAEAMGIHVFRYKLLAFFMCCALAGVAGSLLVHSSRIAQMEQFTLWGSIWYVAILIIGGMGSVSGTIFGVLFVRGLEEISSVVGPKIAQMGPGFVQTVGIALPQIVLGILVILFLIAEPRGLAHRWASLKNYVRLWPLGRL